MTWRGTGGYCKKVNNKVWPACKFLYSWCTILNNYNGRLEKYSLGICCLSNHRICRHSVSFYVKHFSWVFHWLAFSPHSKMSLKVLILLLFLFFILFIRFCFFSFFINLVSQPPSKDIHLNWKLVNRCEYKCEYVRLYLSETLQGVKMCKSILKSWYVRSKSLLLTKKHQSIQVSFQKAVWTFFWSWTHIWCYRKKKKNWHVASNSLEEKVQVFFYWGISFSCTKTQINGETHWETATRWSDRAYQCHSAKKDFIYMYLFF